MSIPDSLLDDYIKLATDMNDAERQELIKRLRDGENPMTIKKIVAYNIVKQYNGEDIAGESEAFFRQQVQ